MSKLVLLCLPSVYLFAPFRARFAFLAVFRLRSECTAGCDWRNRNGKQRNERCQVHDAVAYVIIREQELTSLSSAAVFSARQSSIHLNHYNL